MRRSLGDSKGGARHPGEGGENAQAAASLSGTALGQEAVVALVDFDSHSRTWAALQMSHARPDNRRLVGHLLGIEKGS